MGQPSPELLDLGPMQWLYYPMTAPARFHTGITEFTKTLNYRAMVRMQSLRMSRDAGMTGDQVGDQLEKDMASAFDPNGKAIIWADAKHEAQRATFTLPLEQGTSGKDIQEYFEKHPVQRASFWPRSRRSAPTCSGRHGA